ncbi:MAG: hypothetical protein HOI86_11245 [Tateyamaria sp.]|jgi:hypothetical protein|nr:hypothetical protein [Tateyamaria sp.]MBT6268239.1 hypothetical protein [Tateyamaria sp.]MBT6345042.1 hypothetical protein [Tateyamaria sp.]
MTFSTKTESSRTFGTIVLRGGRLTKWKGKAESLSGFFSTGGIAFTLQLSAEL